MIDWLSFIESLISLVVVVMMAFTIKRFMRSSIRMLMFNITLTYITFGLSTIHNFFINTLFIGSVIYDFMMMINYGLVILSFMFAMRAIHFAGVLIIGFGDASYGKKLSAKRKVSA